MTQPGRRLFHQERNGAGQSLTTPWNPPRTNPPSHSAKAAPRTISVPWARWRSVGPTERVWRGWAPRSVKVGCRPSVKGTRSERCGANAAGYERDDFGVGAGTNWGCSTDSSSWPGQRATREDDRALPKVRAVRGTDGGHVNSNNYWPGEQAIFVKNIN